VVVHCPLGAALYAERATALLRLKRWDACRCDALRALAAQNDCKVRPPPRLPAHTWPGGF
jgi:hypothetical protein